MRQEPEHLTPAGIRSEVFSHRMRGLDEDEVRAYLEVVADQVAASDAQLAAQRSELEQLRQENRRLREEADRSSHEISPQAVALFSQAQQVADQLVEEAVVHARDLMMAARSQQRDIIQRAHEAAEEAVRRTGAPQVQAPPLGYSRPVPEVEYVRTFARVAQVQLRSVLDALAEQVDRLGEVPQLDRTERAGSEVEAQAFTLSRSREQQDLLGSDGSEPGAEVRARIYEQVWSMRGPVMD